MRILVGVLLLFPALVWAAPAPGYYLIAPPAQEEPDATLPPLSTWPRLGSFGSLIECGVALRDLRHAALVALQAASPGPDNAYLVAVQAYLRANDAQCLRANDPRLR